MILRNVRLGLGGPLGDVRLAGGVVAELGPSSRPPPQYHLRGGREIDGHGGTLLPGLVDAHVHAAQWASHRRRVPLDAARSAREAVDLVVRGARDARPGELVTGGGFRDGLWPDAPHKDLLARALPDQPVALFSNDLHTVWLSPAALRLVGREHPTGGWSRTSATPRPGRPDGGGRRPGRDRAHRATRAAGDRDATGWRDNPSSVIHRVTSGVKRHMGNATLKDRRYTWWP